MIVSLLEGQDLSRDNIQYLVNKQVRPIIKAEMLKMKNNITEAIEKLESIPADGKEEEWESIWEAFYHASDTANNIAEMKAALMQDQKWNFVPSMDNNHAQAYAKLAIQSLQVDEPINDELRDKIVNRMSRIFDDKNEVEAIKEAFG